MAAFTTITNGLDWTDIAIVNELILGYNERKSASFNSARDMFLAVAGDDATDINPGPISGRPVPSFGTLQTLIQAQALFHVNHTINGGSFQDQATIDDFTVATWRSVAGMHADGYRRATAYDAAVDDWTDINDAMFSHGPAEEGDILGPWIVDDLQKGLSAIKWTQRQAGVFPPALEKRRGFDFDGVCATALSTAQANYTAASYVSDLIGNIYYEVLAEISGSYVATSQRRRSKVTSASFSAPTINASIDVYYYIESTTGHNIDGLTAGLNQWAFHETLASAAGATRTNDTFFPGIDTEPIALTGISCPAASQQTKTLEFPVHLYKWEFTNSN